MPFFFLCLLEDMASSTSLSSAVADPAEAFLSFGDDAEPAAGPGVAPDWISLTWVGAGAGVSTFGFSSFGSAATLGFSSLGSSAAAGAGAGAAA